jgi:hypothetical protein
MNEIAVRRCSDKSLKTSPLMLRHRGLLSASIAGRGIISALALWIALFFPGSAQAVTLSAGSATVSQPGDRASVCVDMASEGRDVAGVQNDLVWDSGCATIEGRCEANPSHGKNLSTASPGRGRVRAILLSFENVDPIPDSELYCCQFRVVTRTAGSCCSIAIENAITSDPKGQRLPTQVRGAQICLAGAEPERARPRGPVDGVVPSQPGPEAVAPAAPAAPAPPGAPVAPAPVAPVQPQAGEAPDLETAPTPPLVQPPTQPQTPVLVGTPVEPRATVQASLVTSPTAAGAVVVTPTVQPTRTRPAVTATRTAARVAAAEAAEEDKGACRLTATGDPPTEALSVLFALAMLGWWYRRRL